jgi:hypothetical protein
VVHILWGKELDGLHSVWRGSEVTVPKSGSQVIYPIMYV